MQLHVNPHQLILIGENSFLRLSTDGGQTASTRCSHWRVLWSPAGGGHALFVDSGVTAGVRIYADSVPLLRFLQTEIECLLYKPFSDTRPTTRKWLTMKKHCLRPHLCLTRFAKFPLTHIRVCPCTSSGTAWPSSD